jgi:hypothetical protein
LSIFRSHELSLSKFYTRNKNIPHPKSLAKQQSLSQKSLFTVLSNCFASFAPPHQANHLYMKGLLTWLDIILTSTNQLKSVIEVNSSKLRFVLFVKLNCNFHFLHA